MFGNFIKEQRTKRGMSQEYIASELNISRPTYLQIERGLRELTMSEARKMASIFNLQLEDFLDEKEPKQAIIIERGPVKKSNDLEIRITKKDLDKFKQVLLYILNKVGGKPNIGETVLHKLLYFIDFDYYEKFEENLMGATYIKNHHGPTSVELNTIIQEMQDEGDIEAVNSQYFKYSQKKYLPLKSPNLKNLSAREIEHIDNVLARLSDKNAIEIEKYSHEDIPWKSAREGKPISYESVFYRDEKYSVRNYDDEL
jgi:transcriptional regulator with XRE-family HTH domain